MRSQLSLHAGAGSSLIRCRGALAVWEVLAQKGGLQDALTPENLRFLGIYAVGAANGMVMLALIRALRRRTTSEEDVPLTAERPPLPEVPPSTLPPPPPPAPTSPFMVSPPYRPFLTDSADIVMNLDE